MDLSGHGAFRNDGKSRDAAGRDAAGRAGARLLTAAWVALSSGRMESVTLHLRSGPLVEGVLQLRVEGAIAEAATKPGEWTHLFAVEDVVLVQQVPRGGKR